MICVNKVWKLIGGNNYDVTGNPGKEGLLISEAGIGS